MSSFFQKTINSMKRPYKVELEVVVNGQRNKLVKYVSAWSKAKAAKQAQALSLHDIKISVNQVTGIKRKA